MRFKAALGIYCEVLGGGPNLPSSARDTCGLDLHNPLPAVSGGQELRVPDRQLYGVECESGVTRDSEMLMNVDYPCLALDFHNVSKADNLPEGRYPVGR
ncbi:hypothetical protein K8W59_02645 [Nocardioides rotundus]|uniref:hypothetical protein n=1 Tax=Nocardioides rotundus TaxID=1774216 RepID=UPI001CBD8E82|nr:hypothetical protein [Nocardioides rotundus]UAL30443.1 hypothetical protein K8W59_02645 [Nocardioides rotundus]